MKKLFSKLPTATVVLLVISIIFFVWGGYQNKLSNAVENTLDVVPYSEQESSPDKNVLVNDTLSLVNAPVDPLTNISASEGYVLVRSVEMYQYFIESDTVYMQFFSSQQQNISGLNGEEYINPVFPDTIKNTVFLGDVKLKSTGLDLAPEYVLTFASDTVANRLYKYFDADYSLESLVIERGLPIEGYTLWDIGYYTGDTESPQIGDLRVVYYYLPCDSVKELTLIGKVNGNTFGGAEENDGEVMTDKTISVDGMKEVFYGDYGSTAKAMLVIALVCLIIAIIILLKSLGVMGKKAVKNLAVILVALSICLASFTTLISSADFGDFGGDSDFGGGGGGDFDFGGNDYDYDYDDDDDEPETTAYWVYAAFPVIEDEMFDDTYIVMNTAGEELNIRPLDEIIADQTGDTGVIGVLFLGIGFIIVFVSIRRRRGMNLRMQKLREFRTNQGAQRTDRSLLNLPQDYKQLDENFDLIAFTQEIAEMYVKFQNSWQAKDMTNLREHLTDPMYARCEQQLDNYKRTSQTNVISDIVVENVSIIGWRQEGDLDVMVAELQTQITDYVVDDSTGAVVRGDMNARKRMCYEWNLVRKTGVKTGESLTEVICPNCGATTVMNAASECEYCGSLIENEIRVWAVSEIKGLSQQTLF